MRHVSFEEMAAHIRQLIQENRYLSPEELERYQKGHAATEPEAPKAEAEKSTDWATASSGMVLPSGTAWKWRMAIIRPSPISPRTGR